MTGEQALTVVWSIISGLLSVAIALLWWNFKRVVSRLDGLEGFRMGAVTDLSRLKDAMLTGKDLQEAMESTLEKSLAPVTSELRAIRADQIEARKEAQNTRERLIRLEAEKA